jgi:competence protein ComEC
MDKSRGGSWDGDSVARRPAVAAAVLFAAGIAAHRAAPHVPAAWLGVTGTILLVAWFVRGPRASSVLLGAAVVVSGLAAAQLSAYFYPRDHVGAFVGDGPRLAHLELHIDHPPRTLTNPFSGTRHPLPPKQVTTATVTAVKTWEGWQRTRGQVLVQIAEPHPRLAVNQTVRVVGMLQRPAAAMNPGQFDWAAYYREQRILNSVQVSHAHNIEILQSPGRGPVAFLRAEVRGLLASGFSSAASLDHALLGALLLGDHDPQLRDVQEQFKRTGTGHHLAISGMHVAVLGGFVFGICRLLCLPPRVSAWAVVVFVILYGLVALPSPPVVRSVLLCVAFSLGLISRRSVDALQLLALSVLAMLVYHPLDLYNPGFQLSFGTVLGLILFTKPMLRGMRRDPDVLAMPAERKPGAWNFLVTCCDKAIVRAFAAGVVAWGVSFPLIAYHFEQLNPWAVVAGIALAPVVMVALIAGLLKIVLTLLWPGMAGAWAAMAAAPVAAMRQTVDWLTALPGGDVPVPPPPVWMMLLFYLLLLPALWPCHRAGLRWCLRGGRAVILLLMVLLPFQVGLAGPASGPGRTRVTLLSVGAGQCVVVEPPSGRTIVIDAGSTGLTDLLPKCLGPFLRHRGITSVDTVVVSHANYDHYSAVAEVVETYGVREVLTASSFTDHAAGSASAEAMLAALAEAQRPPRLVGPGETIPLGRETSLEVLWPRRDGAAALPANDASLVLKLTHAGRSVLFTGDIQDEAMRELLRSADHLKSDVLVAPHHGSFEQTTTRFIAAVDPSVIVSSNDRTLTAKQRALDRAVREIPVLRTHRCGAITVTMDAEGNVRVETTLPRP